MAEVQSRESTKRPLRNVKNPKMELHGGVKKGDIERLMYVWAMNARYIAEATSIPAISDADTGYGNAVNVMRTVWEFERAGVAGIHIEDQVAPKRCGHLTGKEIVSTEEMVGKIRAACAARNDFERCVEAAS